MNPLRRTLPLLALIAAGCARAEAQTPAAPVSPPSRVVFGTGTLEADRTAPLAFERPGTLREVRVAVGDIVEPGSVVARLDDRDSALAVQRERAALEAERATLTRLRADELLLGERAHRPARGRPRGAAL
jgi:multidrug efflux pump subunit AcrA (membrane-fusion protein)